MQFIASTSGVHVSFGLFRTPTAHVPQLARNSASPKILTRVKSCRAPKSNSTQKKSLKKNVGKKKGNDEKERKHNDNLNALAVPLPANGVVPVSKGVIPSHSLSRPEPSILYHPPLSPECAAARLSLILYTRTQQAIDKSCKMDEGGESIVR